MIENIEFQGSWRLPDSEIWFNGVVRYSPGEGIILELFGIFDNNLFDLSSKRIILGKNLRGFKIG